MAKQRYQILCDRCVVYVLPLPGKDMAEEKDDQSLRIFTDILQLGKWSQDTSGNFTNHCWVLPKARKFGHPLEYCAESGKCELMLIDMELPEWLENGLVRLKEISEVMADFPTDKALVFTVHLSSSVPFLPETLKSQKGWTEITFSPETEALDREDKHISGEQERP